MAVAVAKREVGGVIRHGVTLRGYAHTHTRQREVGVGGLRHGDALYRVALMLVACCIEGVLEQHVGVERVVAWRGLFFRHTIIKRYRDLRLVGEELAQLEVGRQTIGLVVVGGACCHTVLQAAKAVAHILACEIDRTEVGELHVEVARCSPTARVVIVSQAQLVHPHLTALGVGRQVAHTNDHGLDLAERGVTHDRHLVVGFVFIVGRIGAAVRGCAGGLGLVAGLLHSREERQGHVEHVLLGPHQATVGGRVHAIVRLPRRERQRNFILIIVALIVGAEAYEHRQLVVLQVGGVGVERVGMHKHLHALILPEVEGGVLVHSLRLAVTEVFDVHRQRLLVALYKLGLRGVLCSADAGRQHIIDGRLVVVLLNVDSTHRHLALLWSRGIERLVIHAPLAIDEVEIAKAQNDGLLEACEEHTHETYGCEIADAAHTLLIVAQGYAELVPCDMVGLAVSQLWRHLALVDDVVLTHNEVLGTNGDAILIVFLIFVERVVLVYVLHIGGGLVRGVVALGATVVVGRVALRVIDILVTQQDGGLHAVEVGATEIVVVVASGVCPY